jgi:hypothetical protein
LTENNPEYFIFKPKDTSLSSADSKLKSRNPKSDILVPVKLFFKNNLLEKSTEKAKSKIKVQDFTNVEYEG